MSSIGLLKHVEVCVWRVAVRVFRGFLFVPPSLHLFENLFLRSYFPVIKLRSFDLLKSHSQRGIELIVQAHELHEFRCINAFTIHADMRSPKLIKSLLNNRTVKRIGRDRLVEWRMASVNDKENDCHRKNVHLLAGIVES